MIDSCHDNGGDLWDIAVLVVAVEVERAGGEV